MLPIGGSGIVLRLEDVLFPEQDKALKFPRPVLGNVQLIAEMIRNEIAFLSKLRHPGIVRILDYASLDSVEGYGELPFYIMEFVAGSPSTEFVTNQQTELGAFCDFVNETANIISYLHSLSPPFVHLDLKPDNIMVDASGQPIMIDLGTCKQARKEAILTIVACTLDYAHPQLARLLVKDPSDANRAKGELQRAEIDPRWDLWAFGMSVLTWLGLDRSDGTVINEVIYNSLPVYTRKYYLLLAARLLAFSSPNWLCKKVGLSEDFLKEFEVISADELCEILGRLSGVRNLLNQIPEISGLAMGTIQAAPGSHVPQTKALSEVLGHRLFRRLNSITQLGCVLQVYPGAKHTRREHSLGTYANVIRILKALYNDPYSPLFRQIITNSDCRDILLVALLHDIGQWPLAHDLEEIDRSIFDHEELTRKMLEGRWSGAKTIIFESLQSVFKEWQTNADRLKLILDAKPNTSKPRKAKLLRSIISGPIDADKLDYLFRDARHTDVPYPLGVDVDRLFRCLTVVVIGNVGSARDVPAIGVHAKGKVAADFLTLARYAMFSQVYWHHAVRVQKAMLFRAVEDLLANVSDRRHFKSEFLAVVSALPESLFEDEARQKSLFQYARDRGTAKPGIGSLLKDAGAGTDLVPTDAAVLAWFYSQLSERNLPTAELIERILSRRFFKRLWVISHEMNPEPWEEIANAWKGLEGGHRRHKASLEFERLVYETLKPEDIKEVTNLSPGLSLEKLKHFTSSEIPWLLIDVPGARPGAAAGLFYVLEGQRRSLRKDERAVGELNPSRIWIQYGRDLGKTAGKIRIFCHPDIVDAVEASIPSEKGIDMLKNLLKGFD